MSISKIIELDDDRWEWRIELALSEADKEIAKYFDDDSNKYVEGTSNLETEEEVRSLLNEHFGYDLINIEWVKAI